LLEVAERDFESFDRSIDVHISSLRKKLGDDAKSPHWIETVRGVGYMLKEAGGRMRVRWSLSRKVLLVALLNFLLLALLVAAIARFQFGLQAESFLLGPVRDRLTALGNNFSMEYETTAPGVREKAGGLLEPANRRRCVCVHAAGRMARRACGGTSAPGDRPDAAHRAAAAGRPARAAAGSTAAQWSQWRTPAARWAPR